MHKVFAVFSLALLLYGCSSISNNESISEIQTTFKGSAIYTASGDFDGDGKLESIFITRPDEKSYIGIEDDNIIKYSKLDYNTENLKLSIQDINKDKKEEIIINVIQNNCENCYVYSADREITTLLSPDIIKDALGLQNIKDFIALECSYMSLPTKNIYNSEINLYYTEMDYSENGSIFVSEGSVFNNNINIMDIQSKVSINNNGKLVLQDINMLP